MKLSEVLDRKYSHMNNRKCETSGIVATEIILHDLTDDENLLMHEFLTKAMQGKYDKDFKNE